MTTLTVTCSPVGSPTSKHERAVRFELSDGERLLIREVRSDRRLRETVDVLLMRFRLYGRELDGTLSRSMAGAWCHDPIGLTVLFYEPVEGRARFDLGVWPAVEPADFDEEEWPISVNRLWREVTDPDDDERGEWFAFSMDRGEFRGWLDRLHEALGPVARCGS